jgi:hypothetical protein
MIQLGCVTKRLIMMVVALSVTSPNMVWAMRPPDLSPQIESANYWDKHVLAIIEVRGPLGADRVPVTLIEQFSKDPDWQLPPAISIEDTWFKPGNQKPNLKVGDHLLIGMSAGFIAAVPLADKQEEAKFQRSLRVIKEIRAIAGIGNALGLAIEANDAIAERFVLNDVISRDPGDLNGEGLAKTIRLRNDVSADTDVRLLASRAIERNRVFVQQAEEWDWIAGVLRSERGLEEAQCRKLIGQMISGHPERKAQTVDFLRSLVSDLNQRVEMRRAIVGIADVTNLMDNKDIGSAKNIALVQMLIDCLQDPNVDVRKNAAGELWIVLNYVNNIGRRPSSVVQVTQRASESLRAAGEKERDADAKSKMKTYLERILNDMKAADAPPPLP